MGKMRDFVTLLRLTSSQGEFSTGSEPARKK